MDGGTQAIIRMYKDRACRLERDVNLLELQLSVSLEDNDALRGENTRLWAENARLQQRIEELTAPSSLSDRPASSDLPAFVKANVPQGPRRKPGRRKGHPAALRPMPEKIDVHEEVALPKDRGGKLCCPRCRAQLNDVKHHRRMVEDVVPSKVITTCYCTHSGYCSNCRKHVESRAADQPPAADLPHAQLGINALATAAVMRVCYRLPLRQITGLFADLPGLRISPGAIAKQLQRLSRWLAGQYDRLQLALRAAGVVHADETGWRTQGKNGYLWTLTNDAHTLYHVDASRGGKVIAQLLGEAFGGTLVSDFYAVYDQFDGPQQKCLTHLLRELRDAAAKRPNLAEHVFFKRCKSVLQAMLKLKKKRRRLLKREYDRQVKNLETHLSRLGDQTWNDTDADRLAARLRKYGPRLTTFLHNPQVDGTNNAAERALRPAVIMRKITGGSRSQAGARAWAILASILRTAQQQGREVVETIKTLLQAAWSGKEISLLIDTS
jgi:hypothetical protein